MKVSRKRLRARSVMIDGAIAGHGLVVIDLRRAQAGLFRSAAERRRLGEAGHARRRSAPVRNAPAKRYVSCYPPCGPPSALYAGQDRFDPERSVHPHAAGPHITETRPSHDQAHDQAQKPTCARACTAPPLLGKLGPGLITGAADDDPSGIATYSQGGRPVRLWPALDPAADLSADGGDPDGQRPDRPRHRPGPGLQYGAR